MKGLPGTKLFHVKGFSSELFEPCLFSYNASVSHFGWHLLKVPGLSRGSYIWALLASMCHMPATSHPAIILIIVAIGWCRGCWGWCCSSLWFKFDIPRVWAQNSSSSFCRFPYKWKHDLTIILCDATLACLLLLLLSRGWGQNFSSSFKRLP